MSGEHGPTSPGPREEAFQDLLRAARAGAGWAFARLHAELAPAVAGYARLRGSADPDGLTSEVFLGAFRNIGDFSGDEDDFRSWVFTIAHRRVIDERRRASARPDTVELDPRRHEDAGGDVEAEALAALDDARIRELLAVLTEDQRDVILLRIIGDLSVEETATTLDKSTGAVKQLQRRGLQALRRHLEREGITS